MTTLTYEAPQDLLGADVRGRSATEALAIAGMNNWNQRLLTPTVFDPETGRRVDVGSHRYVVGDVPGRDEPTLFGPVTRTYKPIQWEEALIPMIEDYHAHSAFRIDHIGYYDGGRRGFALFDAGSVEVAGDRIANYLLVTKANDGRGAILGTPLNERLVCRNQIAGALARHRPAVAVRHTRYADPHVVAQVEEAWGVAEAWADQVAAEVAGLAAVPVSRRDWTDRLLPAALGDKPEDRGAATRWEARFDEIVAMWDSPVAADGDNLWRAYNAVTEWEQHHRGSDAERRAVATLTNAYAASAVSNRLLAAAR